MVGVGVGPVVSGAGALAGILLGFTPVTRTYLTNFTDAVPPGAQQITIELWGASGGGSGAAVGQNPLPGAGGGTGGYSRTTLSVVGKAGQTVTGVLGAAGQGGSPIVPRAGTDGGDSAVASGTLALPATMHAGGGQAGQAPAGPGGGGSASGGNSANTSGIAATGQTGAAGVVGITGSGLAGGQGGIEVGLNNAGLPGNTAKCNVTYV